MKTDDWYTVIRFGTAKADRSTTPNLLMAVDKCCSNNSQCTGLMPWCFQHSDSWWKFVFEMFRVTMSVVLPISFSLLLWGFRTLALADLYANNTNLLPVHSLWSRSFYSWCWASL